MRSFDLSPLYSTTVGFDRFTDLLDRAFSQEVVPASYPPFNIEKTSEDAYRISIAAAGFSINDLKIEVRENQLHIQASKPDAAEDGRYLYRGIAQRSFRKQFALADHVRVVGASFEDGMLNVDLKREIPEALKPRSIEIVTSKPTVISGKSKIAA
ncbi:MAG: Hsp20 family protein [Rhodobacteraceae bacterium]|nr:Hsp20 family protein [Paracoccaceae bacterium]